MAPYRFPVFSALNEKYDLEVLFCYKRGNDRFWSTDMGNHSFKYKVLRGIPLGIRGRRIYFNPTVVFKVFFNRPNVVIITLNSETIITTYLAYLSCRTIKCPYALWIAHHRFRYYKPRGILEKTLYSLYMRLEKKLVKQSQSTIAYGQITKDYVVEDLGKNESNVFIGTQVWPEKKEFISRNFFMNPFKFLFIGYINQRKRVRDLIDVFMQLKGNDIELIIAGEGPESKFLEERAKGDERIRFTGYVEGVDKEKLLNEAHVFVMPSKFDNMPNSIIEAMSYGLPVIATKECHCPEWLKENALIFDTGDKVALLKHLNYVRKSPSVLSKMSSKAIELAKVYSVPFAVNTFSSAIENALYKKHSDIG